MRSLFGFLCVSALGVMSVVGCSDDACSATVCPCTEGGIRAAIAAGGGPYTFACDGPTTVATQAEIVIDNDVILDGEGSLTISAGGTHRVLHVPEGTTAELWGITVTEGWLDWEVAGGAGVANEGTLIIGHCVISDNYINVGGGAGVSNAGQMSIVHTTVAQNSGSHAWGGGISNTASGTLRLVSSTVSDNGAGFDGSGTVGGGIHNAGEMTMLNSTVSGNSGGCLGNCYGGGIANVGKMSILSSTISGNSADFGGDAIGSSSNPHAPHGPYLEMANTLVDGDCDEFLGDALEPNATWVSNGYNIESLGDSCGFDQPTDLVNIPDPMLGPLQDNGGSTETHALLTGSVAINRIPEADCLDVEGKPLTEDQRGEPRPVGAERKCDVGPVEVQ